MMKTNDEDLENMTIGGNPLDIDAQIKVAELMNWLGDRYEFINGPTAAYWSLSYAIYDVLKRKDEQ